MRERERLGFLKFMGHGSDDQSPHRLIGFTATFFLVEYFVWYQFGQWPILFLSHFGSVDEFSSHVCSRFLLVVLLTMSLVQLFKIGFFEKVGVFKKYSMKKCFLKMLSIWLVLIKVTVWVVNYQKWQCIYKVLWKYCENTF